MTLRSLVFALLAASATAASAAPAATHQQVLDFIKAAGWEVCDSVANDPPANVPGAQAKHIVQVGKPCAADKSVQPTVLFVVEFDNAGHRDAAIGQFIATYEKAIIEMGDAWPVGDRFAIFTSGPAHQRVKDSIAAEVAKRKAAAK